MRSGHRAFGVAQFVGANPPSPTVKRIVYVAYLVLCGHAGAAFHVAEALHCRLAGHIQVAEHGDYRVETVQLFRLAVLLRLGRSQGFHILNGCETGRAAVAFTVIIVGQELVAARFVAYYAKHIVAEEAVAVVSLNYQRHVSGGFGRRQSCHVGHCLGAIAFGLGLAVGFEQRVGAKQPGFVAVYAVEYRVVNGLKHCVRGCSLLLFKPFYGRKQRVGRYYCYGLRPQKARLEQLAVVLFGLSLALYPLQNADFRLRQVLVVSFIHLLPQCRIGLSRQGNGRNGKGDQQD